MSKLTSSEIIQLVRILMATFKTINEGGQPIAGLIFENQYYDGVRRMFRSEARPYRVNGVCTDPSMEHAFVVDGILCLRGTPVQDGVTIQ